MTQIQLNCSPNGSPREDQEIITEHASPRELKSKGSSKDLIIEENILIDV